MSMLNGILLTGLQYFESETNVILACIALLLEQRIRRVLLKLRHAKIVPLKLVVAPSIIKSEH